MEIQFDSAAPQRGMLEGLKTGLNAGKLIMEEKRLQEAQVMAKQKAEFDQAADQMTRITGLLEKSWTTPGYKLAIYKQMKASAEKVGLDLPELMEWPEAGTEAAKRAHKLLTEGRKAGLSPQELRLQLSEILLDASKEDAERMKPVLESLKDQADNAATNDVRGQARLDANEDRNRRYLESRVVDYSRDLEKIGAPDAIATFSEIKSALPPTGENIPGYGRAGSLWPDFLAGDDGRALRQAVQKLLNIKIKQRSGAAVTPPEFVRLVKEFGAGGFKTEKQFLQGLQQARDSYLEQIKNVNSGYKPEVRNTYYSNNNLDSYQDTFSKMNFGGGAPAKPQTVTQNGVTYTLNPETGEYE